MKALFNIRRAPEWTAGIEIHCAMRTDNGSLLVIEPLVFTEQPPGGRINQPMLRLEPEDAQTLIDALWDVGLRPTEGTGSAGAMAATQAHLKDMQIIANKALAYVLAPKDFRV